MSVFRVTAPLGAALGLLAAAQLSAQEATTAPRSTVEEKITVTANRVETPLDTAGSSVTVLDAEEIERRNKTTVAELLRTVPGVEIVRSAGPGSQASIFIRGAASTHTLVLIDGVRMNSPTVGGFDFADLTTDDLERVEILRGPQSTLYGSEAIGGVISITTRRGSGEPGGTLAAEVGSKDHHRVRGALAGSAGRFDYSLGLAQTATAGISAANEARGNPEPDGYRNLAVSSRLGFALPHDGRLDLALRTSDTELDVDGFGPVDDPNATQDRRGWVGTLAATLPVNAVWTQTLSLGVYDEKLSGQDPDTFFNNFEINTRTTELTTQARLALGESTVLVGASHEERAAEVTGFGYDDSVELGSVYAQVQRGWAERFFVTLGVRNDHHSEFGGETTWRGTLSWAWAARTRLHTSLGTGFRAPSLNELFFPFFGNPDLDPERSEGFDLGLEQRFLADRLSADLTFFSNDFDDLIGIDADFRAVNVDRARSRGLELTLDYRANEVFHLAFSHTWDDTEDRASGAQLGRRPAHRTTLELHLRPTSELDATFSALSVRDRVDTGGLVLEDYVRVDLGLSYQLSHGLEPYLRVENLFDEDYEEIFGFGTPGFTFALGARWGWGAQR